MRTVPYYDSAGKGPESGTQCGLRDQKLSPIRSARAEALYEILVASGDGWKLEELLRALVTHRGQWRRRDVARALDDLVAAGRVRLEGGNGDIDISVADHAEG